MAIVQDEISLVKVKNGVDGGDGVGIKNSTFKYGVSTSGTTKPSNWSTTIPTVPEGQFLWTETTWTYTDNTNEKGYSVAKQGAQGAPGPKGDPTGITVSPTAPTNPYINMLWQNTGSNNGYLTGATYQWNGSKWNLYIFVVENILATHLSAISANLGNITAGTLDGAKIISRFNRDLWLGSALARKGQIEIANGLLTLEYDEYLKTTGVVQSKGSYIIDENGFESSQRTPTGTTLKAVEYGYDGIYMEDANFKYGKVNLGYQDLMTIPTVRLEAAADWQIYATSGSNEPQGERKFRTVTLTGAFKPAKNLTVTGVSESYIMGVLPVGLRPAKTKTIINSGSGIQLFRLAVNPDGTIVASRNRDNNGYSNFVAGGHYSISIDYPAGDI